MDESSTASNSLDFLEPTVAQGTTESAFMGKFRPLLVTEMILSIICLILSIIVYSILPEFKNVHGKNLITMSSCLIVTFVLLCSDFSLRQQISYSSCFSLSVFTHVMFLGTFFWTSVLAYDIWNNVTSMKRRHERWRRGPSKYVMYSVFAWNATLLGALPAVLLESKDWVAPELRPRFGVKRCWLNGKTAFAYYFNIPVGIILFGNLIMFVLTIRKLRLIKKETEILQVKQQKQRLHLYLKLFFVMGIVWFSEFLPWVTKIDELYALAGILTTLQGVFLFAIFVLRKRVLRQIKEKISGKKPKESSSSQHTLPTSYKTTNQDCAVSDL